MTLNWPTKKKISSFQSGPFAPISPYPSILLSHINPSMSSFTTSIYDLPPPFINKLKWQKRAIKALK